VTAVSERDRELPSRAESRRADRRRRGDKPVVENKLYEIQALRTIAVAFVVVYHVWPGALPGGFVGVDIFFVISGFLIGGHLLRDAERNGRVQLTRFWVRRIRRILPASFLVLIAAIVIMFVAIPKTMWPDTLTQVGSASLYVVNWALALQSVDYLAAENPPTVVQHFWSLSVEEQFYIALPILLALGMLVIALVRRLRRRSADAGTLESAAVAGAANGARGRGTAVLFVVLTAVVVVVSLVYSLNRTTFDPSLAYFDTFSRAWEFAFGALTAGLVSLFPRAFQRLRENPVLGQSRLLTLAGIVVLFVGGFIIDGSWPFPAPTALLPVVGTLLVIVGGFGPRTSLAPVLAVKPVQFLGDISYSTYLWHWPLLIGFTNFVGHPASWKSGLVIVAATVLLAWLTKIFVEDPFRTAKPFTKLRWPSYSLAAGGAAVIVASALVIGTVTAPKPLPTVDVTASSCVGAGALLSGKKCDDPYALPQDTDLAAAGADLDTNRWCLTWFTETWRTCEIGDTSAKAKGTIALVGDSYAASFTVAFDDYFKSQGYKVETYTRFGCPALGQPVPADYEPANSDQTEYVNCRVWSERARETLIQRTDISTVVFIGRAMGHPATQALDDISLQDSDVEASWNQLLDAGKKIAWVRTSPDLDVGKIPTCLSTNTDDPLACAKPRKGLELWTPQEDVLPKMGGRVTYIDLTDAFCDASTCYPVIGGVVVFADERHVSTSYSRSIMPYLGPKIIDVVNGAAGQG